MRLPLHLKLVLVSILSVLALMLGLFSSTGVASAHTTVSQASPHISRSFVSHSFNCVVVGINGSHFHRRTSADVFAQVRGSIRFLKRVRVDGDGDFSTTVSVCGFGQREDIFVRNRLCFTSGVFATNISCLRRDSLLRNHLCFRVGAPSAAVSCFRQHRFFTFFRGSILVFAVDRATGRHSNTIPVRADFERFS
jgi:hypothetical protein